MGGKKYHGTTTCKMKISGMKKISLPLSCLVVLILMSSCNNPRPSTPGTDRLKATEESQKIDSEIDTTLHLRFTTAVRSIFEDSKGNYWFGSWMEGVCRFDGENFTYFTEEEGLSHNQVRDIQEDEQGNIWFATGRGISSYDGVKITIQASADELKSIQSLETQWQMKPTDLWFNIEIEGNGEVAKGLGRYDQEQLTFLEFPPQVLELGICKENATITDICRGEDDRTWFANYAGVFGYDGKSFTILKDSDWPYHVRSIYEDLKGNLWIGNNGIGVLLFDGKTTINFSEKHGVSNPEYLETLQVSEKPGTLARVFSIGEDKYGNIWFGTIDAGAWKYDGKILINYSLSEGLTSMAVTEIYRDKMGSLWFGMGDGSACQFNGNSFEKIF